MIKNTLMCGIFHGNIVLKVFDTICINWSYGETVITTDC